MIDAVALPDSLGAQPLTVPMSLLEREHHAHAIVARTHPTAVMGAFYHCETTDRTFYTVRIPDPAEVAAGVDRSMWRRYTELYVKMTGEIVPYAEARAWALEGTGAY